MRHVFWLREGVIAGRSGPNRDPWNPKELADAGIGAVLSVNDGELVHPEDLSRVGIEYRCIPLSDAAPPRPGDAQICASALPEALKFVLAAAESGRAVLVHCSSGKDRTGMFLSYYLCSTEGMRPSQAIAEVRRVRPIALSAEGWELFTLEVLHAAGSMSQLLRFPNAVKRDPAIEAWMQQHSDELGAIAQRWFEVIRGCGDDVRELLHDGHPTACVADAAFAYVDAFKAHVNVGFFRGAEIPDPEHLLEGTGKFMRHVKLRPERDIDATALRKLIAVAYSDMRRRLKAE